MKTALLSTSVAVALLAMAASYILPASRMTERTEPYKYALAR